MQHEQTLVGFGTFFLSFLPSFPTNQKQISISRANTNPETSGESKVMETKVKDEKLGVRTRKFKKKGEM
jgi:hypothetical protein